MASYVSICETNDGLISVPGNATYAAITAVFAANVVLVAYIVSSVLEDKEAMNSAERSKLDESRKER